MYIYIHVPFIHHPVYSKNTQPGASNEQCSNPCWLIIICYDTIHYMDNTCMGDYHNP